MSWSRTLSSISFAVALSCAARAESPAAVLMSLQGDVFVHRPQNGELPGSFGMHLGGGDEIVTAAGAAADIFFASGQSIHLGPDSRITIQGAPAAGGSASFEGVQNSMQLRESRGTSSVARLRSGGGAHEVRGIAPSATKLRGAHPTFRWSSAQSGMDWTLRVYDADGEIWAGEVHGESLRYPDDAPALAPGVRYSWAVESADPLQIPPLRSAAASFELLDPTQDEAVGSELESLPAGDLSPSARAILEASVYYRHGLLDEAIARMERQADDADDALRGILAQLYVEAGRVEDALIQMDQLAHPN